MKKEKLKPIFSGENSRDMWNEIINAKTKEDLQFALYFVCCRLQTLEARLNKHLKIKERGHMNIFERIFHHQELKILRKENSDLKDRVSKQSDGLRKKGIEIDSLKKMIQRFRELNSALPSKLEARRKELLERMKKT